MTGSRAWRRQHRQIIATLPEPMATAHKQWLRARHMGRTTEQHRTADALRAMRIEELRKEIGR